MDRIALTILALMIAGAVVAILFSRIFKKKWILYLPSVIGVLVITFYSFKIESENLEGFQEIGYVLLMLMGIFFIIGNFLTTVFIVLTRGKKERNAEVNTDKEV